MSRWQVIRISHVVGAILGLGLAYLAGPSWNGMVDMLVAGFNGAAVFYVTLHIRTRLHLDMMTCHFNSMCAINDDLQRMLEEKHGELPPGASDDRPRLH